MFCRSHPASLRLLALTCASLAVSACASGGADDGPLDKVDASADISSPVCGNGTIEPSEFCDTAIESGLPGACPTACDDGNRCTVDSLRNAATRICRSVCEYSELKECEPEDGCCPAGCDPEHDSDCSVTCGNGKVEATEQCDTAIAPGSSGACIQECDDQLACTTDLLLAGGTCHASCAHYPIASCIDGDGCCPSHCNELTDNDCGAGCGNGVVDPSEQCDTAIAPGAAGACPQECDDDDICTADALRQGGSCQAHCEHTTVNVCVTGDGCCPAGCSPVADADCAADCGNGVIDSGETCDTALASDKAGSCPESCDDGKACTTDTLYGIGTCYARCEHNAISTCGGNDGCCPADCTAKNDPDCSTSCGNGQVETDEETCDTAIAAGQTGACPQSCDDGKACTRDTLLSAGTCSAECLNETIEACTSGDGCCPAACNALSDSDCEPECGNSVVEPQESCDTAIETGSPGACPQSCEPSASCSVGTLQQGGTCSATCSYAPVTACTNDDGCCPAECDATNDSDCRVTEVASGGAFSCAVTRAGSAYCWGANNYGQLGTGNNAVVYAPQRVVDLEQVDGVWTGSRHGCARTTQGRLYCWGYNSYGQLGTGTTTASTRPLQVVQMDSGVVDAGAGTDFSCAVKDGKLWCWGYNYYGQLGLGDTTTRKEPTVAVASGASAVATGNQYACAIVSGRVQCWGYNNYGQLGIGVVGGNPVLSPTLLPTLTGNATAVSAGDKHTCAIVDGGLFCWGYNGYGQLGSGNTTQQIVPYPVVGLDSGVAAVSCGTDFTCALRNTGEVLCFGRDHTGQLGNGWVSSDNVTTPGPVTISATNRVSSGATHVCAASSAGTLHCWGSNSSGQLGNGHGLSQYEPTNVNLGGVVQIVAGASHTCARTSGATVSCWGYNNYGQLGTGDTVLSAVPKSVPGLTSVSALSAGDQHNCAIVAGTAKCWGRNNYGQLGTGSTSTALSPTTSVSDTLAIANGSAFGCQLTSVGGVRCWGAVGSGQLGDDGATTSTTYSPVDVVGLASGVGEIAAHGFGSTTEHACARLGDGTVSCWGEGSTGQLGSGYLLDQKKPQPVVGLSDAAAANVTQIALGNRFTCAIDGGVLKCWGYNGYAQLGLGHTGAASLPQTVTALSEKVVTVATGGDHTCALSTSGALYCWGRNDSGQVGTTPTTRVSEPYTVFASKVTAVGLGSVHSCAVHDGQLKCWGYNLYGQLGFGVTGREDEPSRVVGF